MVFITISKQKCYFSWLFVIFPIWKGCNGLIFLNIVHLSRFQLLSSNLHSNHNMFNICHPFVTLCLNCMMHIQDIKAKCKKLNLFSNWYAYNENQQGKMQPHNWLSKVQRSYSCSKNLPIFEILKFGNEIC
jgi:hypothetical protein